MAGDPQNQQYTDQSKFFSGNGAAYASTGAPGTSPPSAGIDAGEGGATGGGGTPVLITPSGASLAAADVVYVNDFATEVPSEVQSYGPSPDPLTGIGAALGVTGAGLGHVAGPAHPNSAARPS